jgi:DNA (cytosine-5)-methyltransferase 1
LLAGAAEGPETAASPNCRADERANPELIQVVAHTLRGEAYDASEDGCGRGRPIWPTPPRKAGGDSAAGRARYLTPRECERLQGIPDDYTLIPWRGGWAPDGPRYRAIGNGMAVPCLGWLFARLAGAVAAKRRGRRRRGGKGCLGGG